jgi:hypothetical protein
MTRIPILRGHVRARIIAARNFNQWCSLRLLIFKMFDTVHCNKSGLLDALMLFAPVSGSVEATDESVESVGFPQVQQRDGAITG